MDCVHWEDGDGPYTVGGRQWAVYTGGEVVGHVHWEDGGGLCMLGGKWWAVYTGKMVMGHVQWEPGGGPCTLGRGLWGTTVGTVGSSSAGDRVRPTFSKSLSSPRSSCLCPRMWGRVSWRRDFALFLCLRVVCRSRAPHPGSTCVHLWGDPRRPRPTPKRWAEPGSTGILCSGLCHPQERVPQVPRPAACPPPWRRVRAIAGLTWPFLQGPLLPLLSHSGRWWGLSLAAQVTIRGAAPQLVCCLRRGLGPSQQEEE